MGNSYYNNVAQWSRGEYAGANNSQDDIAVIANKLNMIGDDHGDRTNDATPLVVEGSGEILVSNPETDPHNGYGENKGVIETLDAVLSAGIRCAHPSFLRARPGRTGGRLFP